MPPPTRAAATAAARASRVRVARIRSPPFQFGRECGPGGAWPAANSRQNGSLTRDRSELKLTAVEAASPRAPDAEETVGQRLRRLRLERGLSQREIASPGVTYAYISRIEQGQRKPSVKAMRALARKLRVPLEYLETGDPLPSVHRREVRLGDAELALRLQRDPAATEQAFRELLTEAHREADEAAALRARVGLGLALAHRGEYREAIQYLERATESAAVAPVVRPDVYAALGRCYAMGGGGARAVELFTDALTTIPEDDLALRVRFTAYLSAALADLGELSEAREVAATLSERADLDARGRAMLYWAQARAESMDGDALAAMALMRRALGLLDTSDDALGVARAHLLCAEILLLNEQAADDAEPHLTQAARLFELGADRRDLGALRTQQAYHAAQRGDPDKAAMLARRAVEDLAEDPTDQGGAYRVLGIALSSREEYAAAIESFERAAALLEGTSEWRELAATYRAWARTLERMGRQDEALDLMERATVAGLKTRR
jgi:transcriptional regulator with XRE-family HTH domain